MTRSWEQGGTGGGVAGSENLTINLIKYKNILYKKREARFLMENDRENKSLLFRTIEKIRTSEPWPKFTGS